MGDNKKTLMKVRISGNRIRAVKDLGQVLLMLIAFAVFFGLVALIKLGTCYQSSETAFSPMSCLFPNRNLK